MNIYFEKIIPLPLEEVFLEFSDVNFIPNISGARSKRIIDGESKRNGVGAIRKITIIPFLFYLHEKITEVEANETISYTIINLNLVKHHKGILKFKSIDARTTQLKYTIEFETSLNLLTKLICWVLEKKINEGLDLYIKKNAE